MAYVKNFFDKERNKEAAAELQPALEPNSQSDNQTYQTVTIHSDFEHVTWGSLQPEVILSLIHIEMCIRDSLTSSRLSS